MLQLDDNFLDSVGLAELPAEEKRNFLHHAYRELKMRVGVVLTKGMEEGKLIEFEQLTEKNELIDWFEKNCPGYKETVTAEIDKLRQEILDNKEAILGRA